MNRSAKEQSAYMNDWKRHLYKSDVKLPNDCRKYVLLAFCDCIAVDSDLGRNCKKGNLRISQEIGMHRKYLKKYRDMALELGWFKPTGEVTRYGIDVLEIAIPGRDEYVSDNPDVRELAPRELVSVPERLDDDEPMSTPEVFFDDARDDTELAPWDMPSNGESDPDDPWSI